MTQPSNEEKAFVGTRKPIIAANWKMNMTAAETAVYLPTFLREMGNDSRVEAVLAPPFTLLAQVAEALNLSNNVRLGAQDMHWQKNGAYTGEISASMLRDLFTRYVILGHSERRTLFGETDEIVNRKVLAAYASGLKPIVCIGETLEQRDAGEVNAVLERQLRESLAGVEAKEWLDTVIAYEPIWAIGTGRTATAEQAQETHAAVRAVIASLTDEAIAQKVRIQYGGSVKPDNARELLGQPDIDGALVGGASLDPRAFAQIVKAALPLELQAD